MGYCSWTSDTFSGFCLKGLALVTDSLFKDLLPQYLLFHIFTMIMVEGILLIVSMHAYKWLVCHPKMIFLKFPVNSSLIQFQSSMTAKKQERGNLIQFAHRLESSHNIRSASFLSSHAFICNGNQNRGGVGSCADWHNVGQ